MIQAKGIRIEPEFDILMWTHADLVTRYFQTRFIPGTLTRPERPHDPPPLEKDIEVTIEEVFEQIKDWDFSFTTSFESAGGENAESMFNGFYHKMAAYVKTVEGMASNIFQAVEARKRGDEKLVLAKRRNVRIARQLLSAHRRFIVRYLVGMISGDKPYVRTKARNRAGIMVKYETKAKVMKKITDEMDGLIAKLITATKTALRGEEHYKTFIKWRHTAQAHAQAFGQMLNEMVLNRRIR
jgi:hypothetical protein